MLQRAADTRGKVGRVECRVRANFDEGAREGFEGAVARRGIRDVDGVACGGRREGKLEIRNGSVMGLCFRGFEGGMG